MKKVIVLCLCVIVGLNHLKADYNDSLSRLLTKNLNDSSKVRVLLGLAKSYINSNADSALSYAEEAYAISKELASLEELGQAANILGVIHMNKTQHELALNYHVEAAELFKKTNNERGVAFAYNNMGSVYFHIKNYEEALHYYQLSLDLKLKLNLLKEASSTYVNIGNIYMKQLKYDSSAMYYERGLENARKNGDVYNTSIAMMNLGEVAYVSKEYAQALSYFNAALKYIQDNQNDPFHVANCYYAIGKIYGDTKKYKKAEANLLKALTISEESGLRLLEININRYLSQFYEQTEDLSKAYKYFKKYHVLNDSIFNSENLKQIEDIKQKYESELKDQQILENETKLQREATLRNSFIIAFLLIGVICVILYRNINLKKKANDLLRKHQKEIELHQKEIERKNEELSQMNIELVKENVFTKYEVLKNKVNPHFLFNSLSTLSYLIVKEPEKAIDYVESFSKLYRNILELESNTLVTLQDELEIVEEYLKLQRIRYKNTLEISMEIETGMLNRILPPFSIQLLIENALKHNMVSESQPLKITLKATDGRFIVLNNIKTKYFPEPSTGVGQKNIRERYKLFTDLEPVFQELDGVYSASIPLVIRQ